MRTILIKGYDNLIKELQQNNVLKVNIDNMVKYNSPIWSFYDNDRYIVLRMEDADDDDDFENIHILNGNDIEFIEDN